MADLTDVERRQRIHALLQELGPTECLEGSALLTGWVLVASWVDESGDQWLSKAAADEIPIWTAEGMLHNALNTQWPTLDDQ